MKTSPNIFILMGVSASGKTTLGRALAEAAGGKFFDGDDFHTESNREKMASGQALTDEDRQDWLNEIARLAAARATAAEPTFIACSALKQAYRDTLLAHHPSLTFLFLTADPETLRQRITQRHASGEHFMPPELLDSQLATLEAPSNALELDSSKSIPELASLVKEKYPLLFEI